MIMYYVVFKDIKSGRKVTVFKARNRQSVRKVLKALSGRAVNWKGSGIGKGIWAGEWFECESVKGLIKVKTVRREN